jgi:hypothetical protein
VSHDTSFDAFRVVNVDICNDNVFDSLIYHDDVRFTYKGGIDGCHVKTTSLSLHMLPSQYIYDTSDDYPGLISDSEDLFSIDDTHDMLHIALRGFVQHLPYQSS